MADASLDLYDPRIGGLAFKVETVSPDSKLEVPRRSNYFTVLWVQQGRGGFLADLVQHPFAAPCLICFVPYQAHQVVPESPLRGQLIQFHANFFCIETHHEEVGCDGVLFNDVHGVPLVRLDGSHEREFDALVGTMRQELREGGLAHAEVLLSCLKIFLVRATRLKLEQQDVLWEPQGKRPAVLDDLKALIETHYRELHRPSDYAALLHMTPKALARLVRTHHHKTLTQLIRDRFLKQARWELLHTRKPVKQVARELGFDDVFYFSRLFKQAAGCSPTFFREFETEIRGGRNLSMRWRGPSIPEPQVPDDHGESGSAEGG